MTQQETSAYITLGGKLVYLYDNDGEQTYNYYSQPQGPYGGMGRVLVQQAILKALPTNRSIPLVFADTNNQITIPVCLRRSWRVDRGAIGDPLGIHCVEVVGLDWLAANGSFINAAFNVRNECGPELAYYLFSTVEGEPYGYDGMIAAIWSCCSSFTGIAAPAMPFTPEGLPQNYLFPAVNAYAALNSALRSLSCCISFDPTARKAAVTRLGASQSNPQGTVIYDSGGFLNPYVFQPVNLQVLSRNSTANGNWNEFASATHNQNQAVTNQCPQAYSQTINARSLVPTTYIHDDFPGGGATASSSYEPYGAETTIADRGAQVAANWKAMMSVPEQQLVYSGVVRASVGPQVRCVCWHSGKQGLVTELFKHPGHPKAHSWTEKGPEWAKDEYGQPSDFTRPQLPVTPHMLQVVTVEYDEDSSRYYGTLGSGQKCWISGITGNSAKVGKQYIGKMSGYTTADGTTKTDRRPMFVLYDDFAGVNCQPVVSGLSGTFTFVSDATVPEGVGVVKETISVTKTNISYIQGRGCTGDDE